MLDFPKTLGWDNWGSIMCDTELFAPLVREACRQNGLPCARVEAGFPGTNAVFLVDGRTVAKLYAPLGLKDQTVEPAVYRALKASALPLVPRFLGEGTVCAGAHTFPYILIESMPGTAIREVLPALKAAERTRIGFALGEWARRYHALPVDLPRENLKETLPARLDKTLTKLEGNAPAGLIKDLRAFADAYRPASPAVWVHNDLTEDHLLLAEGRMSIIDFADGAYAPECLEWIPLWFGLCARDEGMFLRFLEGSGWQWSEETRREMLYGTLAHDYGAPILIDVLGERLAAANDIAALLAWYPQIHG